MTLSTQIIWLFVLAIPIACVAWTVTHEEVFREPRQFCQRRSKESKSLIACKFFYLFTCEFCFSHYVAIAFLILTRYALLMPGWRGYIIALFALVWIANIYMSIYAKFRMDIKIDRLDVEIKEKEKDL